MLWSQTTTVKSKAILVGPSIREDVMSSTDSRFWMKPVGGSYHDDSDRSTGSYVSFGSDLFAPKPPGSSFVSGPLPPNPQKVITTLSVPSRVGAISFDVGVDQRPCGTQAEETLSQQAYSAESLKRSTAQQQPVGAARGYRKLWALVNSVKKGERVRGQGEEVSVEDLIKMVQQLPASTSVVEAILPGLSYLDSRAAAALLKGLAKAGLGARAVAVFDHLRTLPPTDELAQLCDIFTYTTMISQCNTHHQLRRAMELVAEMRSRAIPLNVHTYSALLNVCLKANELDLSLDVYSRMLAEGVTPNLVTYNTLLDIYNKTGRWTDALNVLELLQHQNIRPEARTYNAIISTCNGAGRYTEAVRVYEVMTAAGVEPNGASFSAALTSYARSGHLDAALALFGAMGARGYERGTNTYAAVLAACERPGRWDLALKLLTQMQVEGLRPSSGCLTSAINACLQGGQAARAEQLFDRLCSVCKPDAATFNCLVCVYCRLGKVREAANMLEIMLRSGQHVDGTTFNAAIDTCWATGIVPLQQFAQHLYERASQQGLYQTHIVKQLCGGGYVLDLQLPGGPPHVVLLGLLVLLANLRDSCGTLLTPTDSGSAKVLLRLPVQDQDGSSLSHVMSSQLRSISSPFVSIEPVPPTALAATAAAVAGSPQGSVEELHWVAEASAVAEWLATAGVGLVLGQLRKQGTDGLVACQEDAQRETKCRQAMVSVLSFESNCAINPQALPPGLLPQRADMVRLLLRSTSLLDLPGEVAHDAVQLLDRLLTSSSVGLLAANLSGPALTAACLYLAAHHDLAAAPVCASAFGVQPQQLMVAVTQVQQVLGHRGCVAISAMRVLQLLLERMAVDNRDAAASLQASGRAVAVMNNAVLMPAFVGAPPSVMAAAVLYAARLAAGLVPAWPTSLAALTGYAETHAGLQPYIQAAMQMLLDG